MSSPADQVTELLAQSRAYTSDLGDGQLLQWQRWGPESSRLPPLVLLHGGFGSWNHWLKNLPQLMAERVIWTLDLPGLGASGDLSPPFTTAHFAGAIWTGLSELLAPDEHFEMAGFSFGAMLGAGVAVLASSRCQRFTLIGAAGFGELHVQVDLLPLPTSDMPQAEANAVHAENLRRLMLAKESSMDPLAVYLHGDNLARHRFRSRRLAGSNDTAELLPEIEARLVGVWGSEDATAGGIDAIAQRAELLRREQPEAEFHVLPGIGHWAMYEAPAAVNAILLGDASGQ